MDKKMRGLLLRSILVGFLFQIVNGFPHLFINLDYEDNEIPVDYEIQREKRQTIFGLGSSSTFQGSGSGSSSINTNSPLVIFPSSTNVPITYPHTGLGSSSTFQGSGSSSINTNSPIAIFPSSTNVPITYPHTDEESVHHPDHSASVNDIPAPRVSSYHIVSYVTARYVSTSSMVTLTNEANVSQEVKFIFKLTPEAFISEFVMIVDGISYRAQVREKEVAQKAYNEARRQGQSAAQVSQKSDKDPTFSVDLNLAAGTSVVFNMTYQELLIRDKGNFTHHINVSPGQIVDDLRVDVFITEPQGIISLDADWQPNNELILPNVILYPPTSQGSVIFNPSANLQQSISTIGISGTLVVKYDVLHELNGGDLQVANGYFVHHISPEGLPPAPKKVMFVIDVSGSMSGIRISQAKDALVSILRELREIDDFNILVFHTWVSSWKEDFVSANSSMVKSAITFVGSMVASGGTNMYDALKEASQSFDDYRDEAFPAIIFLTDGEPTAGSITNPLLIVQAISQKLNRRVAIFSIGFGTGVDDSFLQKLSEENQGLYRKVFEFGNATSQMHGFFQEVATPLMYNIAVRYDSNAIDPNSLTKTDFISYFEGKELVVAGKLADDFSGNVLTAVVSGYSRNKLEQFEISKVVREEILSPHMVEDFAQRMWAFLTIKDLLKRIKLSVSAEEKKLLKQQALELSLTYEFVTPLTSLLVIKPLDPAEPTAVVDTSFIDTPVLSEGNIPAGNARPQSSRGFIPPIRRSQASGDPHIIIQDYKSDLRICFDIHGTEGTIVNLVDDPILDIVVNGEMIEKQNNNPTSNVTSNKPTPSFFGRIAIKLGKEWITISRDNIMVNIDRYISWSNTSVTEIGSCIVSVENKKEVLIKCENGISMHVLRNQIFHGQFDHLDFFLGSNGKFSKDVHGIIGQFQRREMEIIPSSRRVTRLGANRAVLAIGDEQFIVTEITRHRTGSCWATFTKKALNMLEGRYGDYVLSKLFSRLISGADPGSRA